MWTYKILMVNMPADFMELYVEYTSPNGSVFTKIYSFQTAQTEQQITDFIESKITELEALRNSYESLMDIVDQTYTFGGV
jgi:hypothetical protein